MTTFDAAAGLPRVDGVPVVHIDRPGSTTVLLTFGVGLLDETYPISGVTHLVEHLAMSTVPRGHLAANASVDEDTTVFAATGRPGEVADFLAQVCAALGDLPLDRIEKECRVLEAEEEANGARGTAPLWAYNLGIRGPALALLDLDVRQLTPPVVTDFASRYFIRENCGLGVIGPLPEGLRLTLPSGPPPPAPQLTVEPRSGPVVVDFAANGVALTLLHPGQEAASHTGVGLLRQRLEDRLRHDLGTTYGVDHDSTIYAPGRVISAVMMDAREGQEAEVARIVWQILREFSEQGPTAEELAFVREAAEREAELPEADADSVAWHARAVARRLPYRPAEQVVREIGALTTEQVREAMAAALPSAAIFVHASDGAQAVFGALPGAPTPAFFCASGPELPGTTYKVRGLGRMFNPGLRRVRLVIGEEGLSFLDPDGDRHTIAWDDLLRVITHPEDPAVHLVYGVNRCVIPVDTDLMGRAPLEDLTRRLVARRPDLPPL